MATLVHQCPHCMAERMTLQISSACLKPLDDRRFRNFVHVQCGECLMPAAAEVSDGNPGAFLGAQLTQLPQSLGALGWTVVEMWPKPPEPRVPAHLPEKVLRAFLAAEETFPHAKLAEASAGSYGRALEIGTKMLAPEHEKLSLFERITKLAGEHRLTPDLAKWAHAIRKSRNGALHDLDDVTKEELTAIRGFTEMVLTYLFTLPGMLKERQAATKEKPKAS